MVLVGRVDWRKGGLTRQKNLPKQQQGTGQQEGALLISEDGPLELPWKSGAAAMGPFET